MRLLRQSTAFTFRAGPFVDSADGFTAETGLSIAQADIQISKDGGAFAQTSASPTTTHDVDGWYQCPLTSTDTNTLGPITIQIVVAGALPVWEHFMVVPANIYDSLVDGSDLLDTSVVQAAGSAITQSGGRMEVNTTHWGGTAVASAAVRATLEQILGTAVTEGAAGRVAAAFQAMFNVASPVFTAASVNQTGDSFARIGATGSGLTTLATQASVDTVAGYIDTEVQTILNRLGAWTGSGVNTVLGAIQALTRTDAATPSDIGGTFDPATDALQAIRDRGDAAWATITAAAVRAAVGLASADLDTQLAAIPTAAEINAEVDAAIADVGLTTTVTGRIDAAISSRLASVSYAAPLDAAGTRAAVGLASANLDTQLAAIDGATSNLPADPADASDIAAAFAALNNISAADVLTQVNAALNTAISELTGVPSATPTLRTAVMFLFMALRNRTTTTATDQTVQNDAGGTIATAALSDDGSVFTKGEFS